MNNRPKGVIGGLFKMTNDKGSPYKKIITFIFDSGVKEVIYCRNFKTETDLLKTKYIDFHFDGANYDDIHINPNKVTAIFVEENTHYDKTA